MGGSDWSLETGSTVAVQAFVYRSDSTAEMKNTTTSTYYHQGWASHFVFRSLLENTTREADLAHATSSKFASTHSHCLV